MSGHIIVGDDGSKIAAAAIEWAAAEAVRREVGLTIIGCFSVPVMTDWGVVALPTTAEVEATRTVVQQRLDEAAQRAADRWPGLVVNAIALGGRARIELVEQARHAELLVVGSSGTGESPVFMLGSVAHALMRTSPCPVVLVPGVRAAPPEPHVVVAVDGTSNSDAALDWAADEADRLGARISVVHVWAYPYDDPARPTEARDLIQIDAATRLERAVERVRDRAGSDVDGVLVEGTAAAALPAEAFSADLVVLGPHHRSAHQLVPVTSVADAVIAHATCPVVVMTAA
jgi:nucleotide-binding universal stress UspA family protein